MSSYCRYVSHGTTIPALPQRMPPKPPPIGAMSVNLPFAFCTSRMAYMCRVRNWSAFDTYVAVREKTLMSPDQPMRSFRCGQSVGIDRKLSTLDHTRFDHNWF